MGEQKYKSRKRKVWLLLVALAVILIALWQLAFKVPPEKEKALRQQFREEVARQFPEQANQAVALYGLRQFQSNSDLKHSAEKPQRTIVLVHGLDEPGKVWMNLAPILIKEGFDVWEMHYPNDQPIVESAHFFLQALMSLTSNIVPQIAIVAHSMGGLVSRELLTNPELNYMTRAQPEELPEVVALIMVGTPNHGSELVRFRVFTEFRDQWTNLIQGKGHWLGWVFDGAGEAGLDLLPGSQFLTSLNSRPRPEGVKMSILAGRIGPWSDEEIADFTKSVRNQLPERSSDILNELGEVLKSASQGLGDGLVTIESTRLDGVPHHIVSGTHLSMIRNISRDSKRVPPAIPIIVEQLKQSNWLDKINN